MTIHSLFTLHILYVIAMITGNIPFYCSPKPPYAYASFIYRVYSAVISTAICWLAYSSILGFLSLTLSKEVIEGQRPLYIVYVAIIYIGFVKVIWLSLISQRNANELIGLITGAFDLNDHISQLSKNSEECSTSKEFVKHRTSNLFFVRFSTLLVQMFVLLVSILYVPIWLNTAINFHLVFRLFFNFFHSIQNTIFFAALFVMWTFYVHLNHRLEVFMKTMVDISNADSKKRMRIQKFCDVSDDIDRITRLYEKCRALTDKVATLFSIQILLSMFHAAGMILANLFFMFEAISLFLLDTKFALLNLLKCITLISYYGIEVWILVAVAGAVAKEVCFA